MAFQAQAQPLLRDQLLQPAFIAGDVTFPNAARSTTALKTFAANYPLLPQNSLDVFFEPTVDQIYGVFGDPDDLENSLLNMEVDPVPRAYETITTHGDVVRAFNTQMWLPMHRVFQTVGLMVGSERGPRGPTHFSGTVDISWGLGTKDLAVLDCKKPLVIDVTYWAAQQGGETNRERLGQELRG